MRKRILVSSATLPLLLLLLCTYVDPLFSAGIEWTEHTVDGDFEEARAVYAADVDGDGDLDVLAAAHRPDDIAWWENDGRWHGLDGTHGR